MIVAIPLLCYATNHLLDLFPGGIENDR
jgi:hypothetical protein